jgi:hypothetical protein
VTLLQTAADVSPHHAEPGQRPVRLPVAEALRSPFPPMPRPSAQASPARADTPRPGTTTLVRRIRKTPVTAAPAEPPASPELMRRVLDGLRRL